MLGRVGGAERGEKWTKKSENGGCFYFLLPAVVAHGGGVRRTGAPRVCDVAFVCSVPIDLYDVTAAAAQRKCCD